ncbi:glycine cleavage system aminomethyltransferase GcvT [Methylotetracoccus oryzae]|uniref:glycine cleavage system aminomethyltransferase GcvT n=1 Tax=Methylotetracoccus oryzae TaxID=1919059 RepID=UPI00111847A2|nr:glycine cleavage system aminomethyltransferase GcvT [Methylotetracoccus oryzae]
MPNQTALNAVHRQSGGKLVEFAGWELPLHYGSQIGEHMAVRKAAGMFDVSHMGVIDLSGPRSHAFVRHLLANDINRAGEAGAALYSCMLNPAGGILDDVIAYRGDVGRCRLVVNAATRERDLDWITRQAEPFGVDVCCRADLSMIAVQGPRARDLAHQALPWLSAGAPGLPVMHFITIGDAQAARTGYTGEDGYELIVPSSEAVVTWEALRDAGVAPCGLGARDSLRLEAGLRLYGSDMDESVTPYDCGLAWTVALEPADRDFIGRAALLTRRAQGGSRFVGLILEEPGVLRGHLRVQLPGGGEGVTTSGGHSPTLQRSIGFARLPAGNEDRCRVEIRGHWKHCRIVPPRFVKYGQPLVAL